MKRINILLTVLSVLVLAPDRQSHAQEVFASYISGELRTVVPDYYYTLRYGPDSLMDHRNSAFFRRLSFDHQDSRLMPAVGRWSNNNGAVKLTTSVPSHLNFGGLFIPLVLKNDILNNKTLNMSFWIRPNPDVVDPGKKSPGAVFHVGKDGLNVPNVSVEIRDKKIVVYISKGIKIVPIITTGFPIDWNDNKGDLSTNGYFFFCITSTWNENGNRCRIYIGRPGGRLYCKYFYCSPFAYDHFTAADELCLGMNMAVFSSQRGVALRPDGISDLMFYTTGDNAKHMLHPDDVLNNFYLQSPLYEGISYEISAGGNSTWGLLSRSNSAALDEEYITVKPDVGTRSITPFGYNRFYIENIPNRPPGAFMIRNMANGCRLSDFNYYPFARYKGPEYLTFKYVRDTNPEVNYRADITQYRIINFDASLQKLAISGDPGSPSYLRFSSGTGQAWYNKAASKVFRGPQRLLDGYTDGKVNLRNLEESFPGRPVKYADAIPTWDYVGYDYTRPDFNMFAGNTSGAYISNRFETSGLTPAKYLSPYHWPNNYGDPQDLILGDYHAARWELLYIQDDPNNKPLYMIREKNDNVAFKAGMVYGDADNLVQQVYHNGLNEDGTISPRRVWNICKVGGGRALTEAEKKEVEESKKEMPQTKPAYNNEPEDSDDDY